MKRSIFHLVLAGVVCAAAAAGYVFLYAAIAAKSAAVTALQDQIDAKTEAANKMAAARATLAKIANDEQIVQGYFVPEAAVVSLINDLEAQGRALKAAVNVLSVSTAGTPVQPALALTLSVQGAFDAVLRTLGAIEYAPYAISVSEFSIGQDAKNSWRADLKLSVGSTPVRVATSTP
ncbi:hypothetical protein HY972_01270 [Candidatus Kaiserbacteria bacterium]|nr:hypothetical protein [Candidatus Kaiserbacteria bacterium]